MSKEQQPPQPTEVLPPDDDDQQAPEAVPEWLQRLRARRAIETPDRQAVAFPPPISDEPPSPPGDAAGDEPDAGTAGEEPAPSPDDGPPAWLQEIEAVTPAADSGNPPWLQDVLDAEPVAAAPDAAPPAAEPPDSETGERRLERRVRRRERPVSASVGAAQSLLIVVVAAVLSATIFTLWTPASFLSDETREGLRPAYATLSAQLPPTPVPTPIWMRRVGIISGHWGPHPSTGRSDPGAVCPDGLTEAEVNRSVAQRVVQALSGRGYDVDLLDEWDPRLEGYQASALLSIHADSCHQFELPGATGYKVAPPSSRTTARADDDRLVNCMIQQYGMITGLPRHPGLTRDMTEYHTFREIDPVTPAAIIEIGFLYEDRQILTERPDLIAEGIVSGLLCFLESPLPTPLPEITPWPTVLYTPTPLDTPGPS